MAANCLKVAAELAARVASAKREQAAQNSFSLEEQLEQKEELLASIKLGINAANILQVSL